jgi:hypothetical protein
MLSEKQLIVKYWSKTNAFYQAKLVEKNQVSIVSPEEADKLIAAICWTDISNKAISVKSREMKEKTYLFTP